MADGNVLELRTLPRPVDPPTVMVVQERRAPSADVTAAKEGGIPWLRLLGLAVTCLAVLLALFVGYLFLFTGLQAQRAQHHLRHMLKPGAAALLGRVPGDGQPVGILTVPAMHLQTVVVMGTSAKDEEGGPGLVPGTALPGAPGVSAIAGRRVAFGAPFGRLGSLHHGDLITVVGPLGKYTYTVQLVTKVAAGKTIPTAPKSPAQLNLFTSDPSVFPTDRLVAVATLNGLSAPVSPSTGSISAGQDGLHGDPSATAPAVVWMELLVAGLVMTYITYRRWRQPVVTWLLAAPVLIALMLLSFGSIVRLLPATL